MQFEVGKCYKHSSGRDLHIVGTARTFYHGYCLIGENSQGGLSPVANHPGSTLGWTEISKITWKDKRAQIATPLERLIFAIKTRLRACPLNTIYLLSPSHKECIPTGTIVTCTPDGEHFEVSPTDFDGEVVEGYLNFGLDDAGFRELSLSQLQDMLFRTLASRGDNP